MHQYRLFGDHGHFSKQGKRDALRVDVHIRRTSKKQLEEVLQKGNAEIWGYRTKMGAVPRSPSLLGEVVAVVIICDTDEVSGTIEMLSVLPEYMGLGLSSALIRHSEYILHKAKKRVMKMKVFIPRSTELQSFVELGYSILRTEPWREMEDVLKPAAYEAWDMLTVGKSI